MACALVHQLQDPSNPECTCRIGKPANVGESLIIHVHVATMIGSAAPSENVYHVQLDGDTAQSPTQLDTLNGGVAVDTFVGFLRIGKHSSYSRMTRDHMLGYTIGVGADAEQSNGTTSVYLQSLRDHHRPDQNEMPDGPTVGPGESGLTRHRRKSPPA